MIPYGKHHLDAGDIQEVVDVLENKFLTQGDMVEKFAAALCSVTGAEHCQLVNSGTSALHIACLAAGVSDGDWVWTSPISFVASANCALYCGAKIDFVDIEPETGNMCPVELEKKLDWAVRCNKLPKAIVIVHYAGHPAKMAAIRDLTERHNVILIEDAAHALGASDQAVPIGKCIYSDMTVFSFHPVKVITSGEGGAVMTNSPELHQRLRLFANHGIVRDKNLLKDATQGDWYYEQQLLGFNYRISDIHAALGLSQLKKLDGFVKARQQKANFYNDILSQLPIQLPPTNDGVSHAWHIYVVGLKRHERKKVFQELRSKGVGVNVHYIPIPLHPYYQSLGFQMNDFPLAKSFYENALTLPLFPTITKEEQQFVLDNLCEILV